ncbi:F-box-like domain superfamily [Sesbania bispinosa]|nr:F-box-like domain superfamily [Sesbania bispinosa]
MSQGRILKPEIVAYSETEQAEDLSLFDSLPNDVVAKILHKLPAQFLHGSARYVCKTWAQIISLPCFIKSHLLHSECGFLIQDAHSLYKAQSIHAREWELKETNLNFTLPGKLRGSSDGVLLINKSAQMVDLYVANPITNQVLKLPTLPSICRLCSHCNNIARISSTGEIKVVSLGRDSNGLYNWYVLTVGKVMSWRKISAKCEPASYLSYVQSLSAGGVIYWTNSSWITDQSVLAIDLHDETVHHLKVPTECHGQYWTLVQMGKEVCCMNCGKNVEMNVWKLKDFHRNEWIMVKSIRFSIESPLRKSFSMPLNWLDSEVLVISVYVQFNNVLVAYHVNKKEYKVVKVGDVARHTIFPHTNSLIRF